MQLVDGRYYWLGGRCVRARRFKVSPVAWDLAPPVTWELYDPHGDDLWAVMNWAIFALPRLAMDPAHPYMCMKITDLTLDDLVPCESDPLEDLSAIAEAAWLAQVPDQMDVGEYDVVR